MAPEIYIMGDIHGSFKPVRDFIDRNPRVKSLKEKPVLILLGDSGINFFLNHRDTELKKTLSKYPLKYFVIRGNHDQRPTILAKERPDEWTTELFFGNFVLVEKAYPNIKYAKDIVDMYFIPFKDRDLSTLVIPGAYSVDKFYRLQKGWPWYPEEQLSEEEMEDGLELLSAANWKCDLVLSHTCPMIYEPTDLFLPTIDQSMVDRTMERYLGRIESKLDYKLWCWGHFHDRRVYPEHDGRRIVMVYNDLALDLNQAMNDGKYVWV